MEKSKQPEAVSSVLKVFGILQALGEQKSIGVTELSQRLMMSKSTTYRFLQTMISLGYVAQQEDDDKYSLTLKLFEVGAQALEYTDLIELADEPMRYLARQTNEAVHLGMLDEDSIIYVHKIDSGYSLRMHSRVGRRNPLYSTGIGKVLLAESDEQLVRETLAGVEFVRHTAQTHENIGQLLTELKQVAVQHYAEDKEEQEPGLRCVAVPVYDRFGKVIAGLSISQPTIRFSEAGHRRHIAMLHEAARTISRQLGFRHYPVAAMAA